MIRKENHHNYKFIIEKKEFASDTDEERYLQLCEDLFALAEDFNRDEHTSEAMELKLLFREFVKGLSEEQEKELQENMDSRGL